MHTYSYVSSISIYSRLFIYSLSNVYFLFLEMGNLYCFGHSYLLLGRCFVMKAWQCSRVLCWNPLVSVRNTY